MEELRAAVTLPLRMGGTPCDNALEITQLKLITDTGRLLPASNSSLGGKSEILRTEEIAIDVCNQRLRPASNSSLGGKFFAGDGSQVHDADTIRTEKMEVCESNERLVLDSNTTSGSQVPQTKIIRTEEIDACVSNERLVLDSNTTSGSQVHQTKIIRTEEIDACVSNERSMLHSNTFSSSQVLETEIIRTEEMSGRNESSGVSDCSSSLPEDFATEIEAINAVCSSAECDKINAITEDSSLGGEGNLCNLMLSRPPLWGYASICGRRAEMEDAFSAVPFFSRVNGEDAELGSSPAHFFGVYDGHGGSQVANYCRHRMHTVLQEELKNIGENNGSCSWEDALTSSFLRIDAEVSGKVEGSAGSLEPIAPDTVGSTSIVAIVCSSEIIVANCGDSRAVLCKGKEALPLSNDHKPDRVDERARIEAAGGKVINWRGYRVSGFLAMSRSIGDRHLKDRGLIANPEITRVRRSKDHDCLILATDGLWDVMTNEEACAAARRRILAWHRKYGGGGSNAPPPRRAGGGVDPAAHAAAEYLSRLSHQKGSADNITVIVIDLRPHWRVKPRAVNAAE
ncbi:protein phosphatase 2C 50-like [Wolffia australiana]